MSQTITPEVLWAQRSSSSDPARNHVFLTISASDVPKEKLKLDLQPTKLTFEGTSDLKKVTYHVELEFYAEIVPEESKISHTGKNIELVLRKKELKEEYWPRLLKESKKLHFLKTDFDKWVDEDEQDENPDEDDYMSRMNPAMMGGGGDGGFGGIDFSKLGAMGGGEGGLPDLGSLGNPGAEEEADDDDGSDDDMPALEGEDHSVPKAESSAKAEPLAAGAGETGATATKTAKIEEIE